MRRVAAAGAVAAALVLAVGPAEAAFPAPQGRLVVVAETLFGAAPAFLDPATGEVEVFGPPVGVHGSVAMSASGTAAAALSTISLSLGETGDEAPRLYVGTLLGGWGQLAYPVDTGGGRPSFSPDGSKLVFASNRNGNWDLFVASSDDSATTDATNITAASTADERNPRWSPDGRTIAYESNRGGNWDVYESDPDGTNTRDVTNDPGADGLGDWSPDSSRLVLSSNRAGTADLYLLPAGGGAAVRLTADSGNETHAAWSPTGETIAYSSDGDGDSEVFVIAPDGSGKRRVTTNGSEDLVQDWQPLLDATPPVVTALASKGRYGKALHFRYRLVEEAQTVGVELEFEFPNGGGGAATIVEGVQSGRIYTFDLSARLTKLLPLPRSFRFCMSAVDTSLNESKPSCARFRFVGKKPKRR